MKLYTYDDITGDGATHSLAELLGFESQLCTYYRLSCLAVVATAIRVGDEDTTSGNGQPIGSAGLPVFIETPVNGQDRQINYDLKDVFVFIPNGEKLAVSYAV